MRVPSYLSYSSLALFESDPDEFFLRYLSENRPGRLPQIGPMSVGSSFDAYVKASLHAAVFDAGSDPKYEFDTIFCDQVDEPNRDFALKAGRYCFECYKLTGAYDELLALLHTSIEPPRFEFKLTGEIGGAPFLGKPDCRFVLDLGQGRISIIFDWKLRGFCSRYATSPSKGYALCRDGYEGKASRSHGKFHKLYMPWNFRGLTINRDWMENCQDEYADQCSLYGWLLDEPIGSEETVIFIDELVSKPQGTAVEGKYPLLRIANHRARVSLDYQQKLQERVERCWRAVTSGHVFVDVSREESDLRIETSEDMAIGLATDGSTEEQWFNEVARPQFKR